MRLRAECPVCGADETHEIDALTVCRCASCGVEFRARRADPHAGSFARWFAQLDLAGLVGELLGAAVYQALRALAQLLIAFVLLAVFAYFVLRWAGDF